MRQSIERLTCKDSRSLAVVQAFHEVKEYQRKTILVQMMHSTNFSIIGGYAINSILLVLCNKYFLKSCSCIRRPYGFLSTSKAVRQLAIFSLSLVFSMAFNPSNSAMSQRLFCLFPPNGRHSHIVKRHHQRNPISSMVQVRLTFTEFYAQNIQARN